MAQLITKLSDNLKQELKSADEIWVAVALINQYGFDLINSELKQNCIQNYLVGIDLPTEPKTLFELYRLHLKFILQIRVYSDKEYFHPKLYLIRKKNKFTGFIGSSNCTNGGLNSNIELTIQTDDQILCGQLLNWFNTLYTASKPLTKKFLNQYQDHYDTRKKADDQDRKLVSKVKKDLNTEVEVFLKYKKEFLYMLKIYRRLEKYSVIVKERKSAIKDLRTTLDYPNFIKIDVDAFFKIHDLGHIISIPKPTIKREIDRFALLLKTLCDENIDIAQRYDRAISGDLEIRGVKEGLISKILAIHDPEKYYVENQRTLKTLKNYGIEFPRGLTKGERYKFTSKILQDIIQQTNFENLAVLDYYLYMEGEKEAL